MTKVLIAHSRPIGKECEDWARENMLPNFVLTNDYDDCDVFISVMYNSLVSEQYISGRRCFNFHPGVLPYYRGSGAYSWAIINGEKETGVTLHELDVNIDTGPIISVVRFPIESWDTAESLYNKATKTMLSMFKLWFPKLLVGKYPVQEQDESKARTYYRKDLNKAMDITRIVRALTFEGKPSAFYTDRNGRKVEVKW